MEEAAVWLAGQSASAFADAVGLFLPARPEVHWSALDWPPSVSVAAGRWLWWEQTMDALPGPAVWAGAAEAECLELGAAVLRETGAGQPTDAEAIATFQEVIGQTLSGLVDELRVRLGREIVAGALETRPALPEQCGAAARITTQLAGRSSSVFVAFSSELVALLSHPQRSGAGDDQPANSETEHGAPPGRPSSASGAVLELELPVSVRLGCTQIPLRELLELGTGSVIELHRPIEQPVEIVVNGSLFGWGVVVVVDGYYGVRLDRMRASPELCQARAWRQPGSKHHHVTQSV